MKLKPCPFCGYNKLEISRDVRRDISTFPATYNIMCPNCKAEGPFDWSQDLKEATKRWNKRAKL